MKRILPRTNEQALDKAGAMYRPGTPLFMFKNIGNTDMYINDIRYSPGEVWGIDHTVFLATLLAAGKFVEVRDDSAYRIRFGSKVTDTSVFPGIFANVPQPIGVLITTEYLIE